MPPLTRSHLARTLVAAGFAVLATALHASPLGDEALSQLQARYLRAVPPGEQAAFFHDLFPVVLARVHRSHSTEVDMDAFAGLAGDAFDKLPRAAGAPGEVFAKGINAALRTLDPYSRYVEPRNVGNDRSESTGSFVGVGLELETRDGAVRVIAAIPGGPAERAGLQAGDVIVRLDDHSMVGQPIADAISRMRGEAGTPVAITVKRPGVEKELTVAVTRDTIRRQVLRSRMEGDMLVLKLSTFSGQATANVVKAIEEATARQQPRGLVLDMRGNGGGLLNEGVRLADAFLGEGRIASLSGRTPSNQRAWQADAEQQLAGVPMVVLVDGRSASATELVADALQQNGRALVMGQRSYGKGTVQSVFPLGESRGALRLTTAIYHGPRGDTVQKVGVVPDVELLVQGQVAEPREGVTMVPSKTRIEQERCAGSVKPGGDPALACALVYLEAGSVEAFAEKLAARP